MFCTECGEDINSKAVVCIHCGVSTVVPQETGSRNSAGLRLVLPVGRSGYAIIAGYLGLLTLIPFVGIGALFFGILGVKDIKKNEDTFGMGRSIFGIIMGGLSTLIYLWVAIRHASDLRELFRF
jgi:hypothetical protein